MTAARQRGQSALFIAVVLILVAAAALALVALTRTTGGIERSSETTSHLAKIAGALEQFAATQERLPCPANPAIDTGDAEPNAASATCTYPTGTVPWRTIGLRREDSLDAWGWKVSYRVYQGTTGLTQAGGASMVHCDTVEPTPAGTTATGLCKSTHDTTEAQFLSGKGLALNDFGTPVTDAAYVLVSHGTSGLGAYTSAGGQKQPNPTSADELSNLSATGPFVAKAAVTNAAPEDASYFDDVLAYRRLADFVKRANLSARDWPEPPAPPTYADITFNSTTIAAATGSTPSPGNLGTSTINFQGATVTALAGGATQNLTYDTSGGYEGIGGANGTTFLSSAASEGVRIDLTSKAQQLGVTFFDFGRLGGPGNPREQVRFDFYNGATLVTSVTGQGCHADGGLATLAINVGADFDRVDVTAIAPTGGSSPTEFLFVQLLSCPSGPACKTSLSVPSNLC